MNEETNITEEAQNNETLQGCTDEGECETVGEVKKPTHTFFIAGVQHHRMRNVLDDLEEDQNLQLVLEPTNKYDPNAVRIEFKETMLGFVPMKFSSEVTAMITIGKTLVCVIVLLNKGAKPWEMCKVEIREVEER